MTTLFYFFREVLTNLRRSPLMNVASVTTVLTLTMILGFFVALVLNLDALAKELIAEIQVVAYLEDTVKSEGIRELQSKLRTLPHVTAVEFVDKETAFKTLMQRLNGRVQLNDVTRNPLPNSFEVKVDDGAQLEAVAKTVQELPGVQKVKYGEAVAHKMMAFNRVVRAVGATVLGLLLASTVLVVSNTIRLTVFARRKEIEIMQMVGAARWFIQAPFVLEGILQGLLGSALAAFLVSTSYDAVMPQLARTVPFLPVLPPSAVLPQVVPGLVLLGVVVGAAGSLLSVNRYLKI